jgi:hypothetical protein
MVGLHIVDWFIGRFHESKLFGSGDSAELCHLPLPSQQPQSFAR